MVYFLTYDTGEPAPIKIGYARDADRLRARIATLQCGSAWPLLLLAKCPDAGRSAESTLHKLFADERMSGEWFQPSEALLRTIQYAGKTRNVSYFRLVSAARNAVAGRPPRPSKPKHKRPRSQRAREAARKRALFEKAVREGTLRIDKPDPDQ